MVDLPTAAGPARRVREALLAGANPFVTLYDGEQPIAYASIWRVDWSPSAIFSGLGDGCVDTDTQPSERGRILALPG